MKRSFIGGDEGGSDATRFWPPWLAAQHHPVLSLQSTTQQLADRDERHSRHGFTAEGDGRQQTSNHNELLGEYGLVRPVPQNLICGGKRAPSDAALQCSRYHRRGAVPNAQCPVPQEPKPHLPTAVPPLKPACPFTLVVPRLT